MAVRVLVGAHLFGSVCAAGQGFTENPAYVEARGPIPVRNGRAFNQLALQFTPESPDVLATGRTKLGLQLDVFNNLLIPETANSIVHEDYEEQRLMLSWRRGIGHGVEAGVFLPIRYRNGGFLDEVLSQWHRFWGIASETRDNPVGRNGVRNYQSEIRLLDRNGSPVVDVGNAFGIGDVSFTVKRPLIRPTTRAAVAGRLGIQLPTGNPGLLLGSGTPDAGLSIDGRYNVGRRLVLFGNLGEVASGGATRVPGARHWVTEFLAAAEIRMNNRDSYLFQLDGNSLVIRTGDPRGDQAQTTFTVGYQRVLDRRLTFYGSFSENGDWNGYSTSALGGIGPDFTVTLGLAWRQ